MLVGLCVSCGDDGPSASRPDSGRDGGRSDAGGTCGNGLAEGIELCDGTDLRDEGCESATNGAMSGGRLSCTDECTFDVSECFGADGGGEDEDGGGVGGTGG